MAKRWLKLKKAIEFFCSGLGPTDSFHRESHNSHKQGIIGRSIGLFTIRLGKETIWKFPRQFVNGEPVYPDGGNPHSFGVRDLNERLRDYLDTPKDALLKEEFPRDYFGMTNILKFADRRIGLERLQHYFKYCEQNSVIRGPLKTPGFDYPRRSRFKIWDYLESRECTGLRGG